MLVDVLLVFLVLRRFYICLLGLARGYRLKKGKSLEEVLKSSTKQLAKLLGFDETPINMVDLDLVPVEHMEIAEVSPAPKLYISKTDPVSKELTSVRSYRF
ncbi:hypothetical protein GIB67_015551 [Kingdonia uniflora]|uniref:Uncharacterized protein n=1 Tax=Kingdonia uniflora TaxID=39325 RepID=A0A7J7MPN1_9MAGN|nr:hypothetical protein GIB67_015551 [Kingdonia uniflora]